MNRPTFTIKIVTQLFNFVIFPSWKVVVCGLEYLGRLVHDNAAVQSAHTFTSAGVHTAVVCVCYVNERISGEGYFYLWILANFK